MKFLGPFVQVVGLKLTGGSPGSGKVLLSDVAGVASWGPVPVAENVETFDPSGTAVTLSVATVATLHLVVLTANCTITVPTPVLGQAHYVRVTQDGTGGRSLTFAGVLNWIDGQVPDQAQGAGGFSVYVFTCDDPAFGWVATQSRAGGGGGYTDEQSRDAVGAALLLGSGTIQFSVDDTADTISAEFGDGTVTTGKLAANVVNNSKLSDMAQATFKMRAAGAGTGDPIDGSVAQAKTALAYAVSDVTGAAPLDSPAFTGDPTAPTQTAGTNNTRIATTAYADAGIVANSQTGTTYTLVLTDQNKVVECTNASAITVTVPLNSSVAFPVGTVLEIYQGGAGQVTVSGAGGVTVRAAGGGKTAQQYASVGLRKRATDEWVLSGGVA